MVEERLPTFDFGLWTSDFRLPTSDFRLQLFFKQGEFGVDFDWCNGPLMQYLSWDLHHCAVSK